jgi:hypothetical protein
MVKQKNNLAAKIKEEQALRSSLPALSRQILELAKTRGEITVMEIEESTGANCNTIKVHLRKLASDNYLAQVPQIRTPAESSRPQQCEAERRSLQWANDEGRGLQGTVPLSGCCAAS